MYLGALDVIAKILLGSKDLNIFKLYILKKDNLIFIMHGCSDQEYRGSNILRGTLFNILDQMIKYNDHICPSFELIVLKK
tara:strand:+ start:198 stop:437 length:240 start_codon:yes stop_codon:yes gene_type:complete